MKTSIQYLSVLLVILTLGACASQEGARRVAKLSVANVDSLNASLKVYIKELEGSASRRMDHLADQRRRTAAAQRDLTGEVKILEITDDKPTLALFNGVYSTHKDISSSGKVANDRITEAQETLKQALSKYASQGATLTKLSTELQSLASKPSIQDRVKFFVMFSQDVRSELECLEKAAKAAEEAAKAEAEKEAPQASEETTDGGEAATMGAGMKDPCKSDGEPEEKPDQTEATEETEGKT